jgi:hypothetical protein
MSEYVPERSFPSHSLQVNNFPAPGNLKNTNTIEDFKNADKKAILNTASEKVSGIAWSTHVDQLGAK